jgi:hypothetical protein
MPLVTCPLCQARTPSTATRCVQCGSLPPACADCKGAGTCPTCSDPTIPPVTDFRGVRVCDLCDGTNVCNGCGGQKRRWPAVK